MPYQDDRAVKDNQNKRRDLSLPKTRRVEGIDHRHDQPNHRNADGPGDMGGAVTGDKNTYEE